VRWIPALSMLLVSVISYIDRNTLALLAPTILRETHLSNQQYGWVILAFSIAYTIGNPLWGWILDRIGVRKGMAASVSLWTLASVSHAFATGIGSFGLARAVLGFGEGATFPGGLRTVVQTLPPELRARGTALAYSGGSLGALITPLVVTPIAAAWGWRGAFWFTGAVGALWLAGWGLLSRTEKLSAPHVEPARADMQWTDPGLWAFMAIYALGAFPLGFVIYQAALYLSQVLHLPQTTIGKVLWIPPLGWETGYFFWGWVTDRYTASGASTPALRKLFLLLAILSLPLAAVPLMPSLAATLAMMFATMFICAGFLIGSVAQATHRYPSRYSGLIAGLTSGAWSALVGIAMPGIGKLFDLHWYGVAFGIAAIAPAAGFAVWSTLMRTPVQPIPAH
jgi:MFS transporter, ACS family, aldohexuronate transporter